MPNKKWDDKKKEIASALQRVEADLNNLEGQLKRMNETLIAKRIERERLLAMVEGGDGVIRLLEEDGKGDEDPPAE